MEINTINKTKDSVILTLNGRLDVIGGPMLEKSGLALVEEGCIHIAVDLSSIVYISSAGLRSLLVIGKKAKAAGGELVLSGVAGLVKEVFEMSGFDTFFDVYQSINDLPQYSDND